MEDKRTRRSKVKKWTKLLLGLRKHVFSRKATSPFTYLQDVVLSLHVSRHMTEGTPAGHELSGVPECRQKRKVVMGTPVGKSEQGGTPRLAQLQLQNKPEKEQSRLEDGTNWCSRTRASCREPGALIRDTMQRWTRNLVSSSASRARRPGGTAAREAESAWDRQDDAQEAWARQLLSRLNYYVVNTENATLARRTRVSPYAR